MSKRKCKNDGFVTVLVPVYNRETYIRSCLKSIMNQTYEKLKIVVVDDGSTDKTVEIVQELIKEDKRISLKKNPKNTGSMNTAMHDTILACETEFFTWIGSDDEYLIPRAIKNLVDVHHQMPDIDYLSFNLKMNNKTHGFCPYCESIFPGYAGYASVIDHVNYDKSSYAQKVYTVLCPPFPWNGIWKTSFFVNNDLTWIEYKGNTWSPDTLNGLLYFSKGMKMHHYNNPLVLYNIHDNQDTQTGLVLDQIRCDVTLIDAIHEWFSPEDFLGKSLTDNEKDIQYLKRLKLLIEQRSQQHKDSPKLAEALSLVATKALLFIWENKLELSEEVVSLKEFFTPHIG